MYKQLLRPLLFQLDAENAHHLSFFMLKAALSIPGVREGLQSVYKGPELKREMWGLTFKNPLGLAAGFDKDGIIGDKWRYMGFGFVELGTVTPRPQIGNPKKRLFRLPEDKAIINRMGFNNKGVDALRIRLQSFDKGDMILGANIGKNKTTPNEDAVSDYTMCFEALYEYVDYFVVNVSSPNTPGLRELQDKEPLIKLLDTIQNINQRKAKPRPLLLKIAPDMTWPQLDDVIEVVKQTKLTGLIATNTTIERKHLSSSETKVKEIGAGGLSGLPVKERSHEVLRYITEHNDAAFDVVGVGGIMNPKDASDRMKAGAKLIQLYTGYVYGGPALIKQILKQLAEEGL